MTGAADERLFQHGEWARIGTRHLRATTRTFESFVVYPRSDEELTELLQGPVLGVSPTDDPPLRVELSADSADAWYRNEVVGRWKGEPVEVVEDPDEFTGLIRVDYSADPDFAAAQGWPGDQYTGWSAMVPFSEITHIEIRRRDYIARRDAVRERERHAVESSVTSRTGAAETPAESDAESTAGTRGEHAVRSSSVLSRFRAWAAARRSAG